MRSSAYCSPSDGDELQDREQVRAHRADPGHLLVAPATIDLHAAETPLRLGQVHRAVVGIRVVVQVEPQVTDRVLGVVDPLQLELAAQATLVGVARGVEELRTDRVVGLARPVVGRLEGLDRGLQGGGGSCRLDGRGRRFGRVDRVLDERDRVGRRGGLRGHVRSLQGGQEEQPGRQQCGKHDRILRPSWTARNRPGGGTVARQARDADPAWDFLGDSLKPVPGPPTTLPGTPPRAVRRTGAKNLPGSGRGRLR